MWQRDVLSNFEHNLDAEQKAKYEDLSKEVGKAQDPLIPSQRSSTFVGPVSDVNADNDDQ